MKDYLHLAILKLRPNSEFAYSDRDYSTIEWFVLNGDAPTQSEIDDTIKLIKDEEKTAEADKAIARAALLERLGITEDEAKLLLT